MRKSSMLMAAGLTAAIALSGCKSNPPSTKGAGSGMPPGGVPPPPSSATYSPTKAPSRVFGIPEAAFPTGESSSSLVKVSALSDQREARVGHPFVYRLAVTNLSDEMTLEGVTVHQDLPESMKTAQGGQGGTGEWRVGSLGPRETREIEVSVIPQAPGDFESCLRVSYNPVLCSTISVVAPELAMQVQAPQNASLCDTIPVRVTVKNTGTGSTDPMRLQIPLAEGMTAASDQRRAFDVESLAPGQSRDFTVSLKPDRTGRFVSRVIARTEGGYEARSGEFAVDVWAPKLEIDVRGPEQAFINNNVPYYVTVTNTGDGPAQNATLNLRFDQTVRVVEPRARSESGAVIVDLGEIPPGATREERLVLTTDAPGRIRLLVSADARCAQVRPAEISTNFGAIAALLLEVVDTVDPIAIGEQELYEINVINQGSGPDHNVQISAEIPDAFEFIRTEGPTPSMVQGNIIRFQPLGTLAPGERVKWLVWLRATQPASTRFKVELKSDTIERPAFETEPTILY